MQILVAEDELELSADLEMVLLGLGYKVEVARDCTEVLERLQSGAGEIAAVLLNLLMPNRNGGDALREIRRFYPDLPVIMFSGAPSPVDPAVIVTAMKSGATDFLCVPVAHEDLREAITRALDMKSMECPRPVTSAASATAAFFGTSPAMGVIHSILAQLGESEAPVLIQGETGSGKEMIARELHGNSPRARKAFFKLNCAALPSELVESELFGFERGAFTGAFERKPGMFEMADGGTILLDEIGDMDVRLQAKLLQVLQDFEFHRIGGKGTIKVDVRVIAATHLDLEKAIQERKFREDLYYRLNVVNLHLPPLREQKEDIIALAEFLLKKHAKPGAAVPAITPQLRGAILAWDWPGNVRELENFARKLLVFQDAAAAARELYERAARKLTVAAKAAAARAPAGEGADGGRTPVLEQMSKDMQQAEADAILSALDTTGWNRKQASALLEIDYKALLYKMKKLGMDGKSTSAGEDRPPDVMTARMS